MSDDTRTHTPAVQAHAQRLGVDLATVQGTGAGGRVTVGDVQAAQRVTSLPEADLEDPYYLLFGGEPPLKPTPVAAGRRGPVQMKSRFSDQLVTVDVYGSNPLVEDAAQSVAAYALAVEEAPAPELFNTGPLPPMTASGIDPKMLNQLPWNARHYAAYAESRAEVLDMIENCASVPDGKVIEDYSHQGRADYEARVEQWLIGRPVDD